MLYSIVKRKHSSRLNLDLDSRRWLLVARSYARQAWVRCVRATSKGPDLTACFSSLELARFGEIQPRDVRDEIRPFRCCMFASNPFSASVETRSEKPAARVEIETLSGQPDGVNVLAWLPPGVDDRASPPPRPQSASHVEALRFAAKKLGPVLAEVVSVGDQRQALGA